MTEDRRTFLKLAGMAGAGAALDLAGAPRAWAQGARLRMVDTPVLSIACEEMGPATGLPIILLHGFPDDARAWDEVAPPLAAAGHRVLAPFLRGYGPTRFRDPAAPRMAEQAAIAQDVVDLADALGLGQFVLCGFDWGGRAASITAALHPERVRAAVLIGGYSIQNTITRTVGGSPEGIERGWYQWYFNTEDGRLGLEQNRHAFCKYLWKSWSPTWKFADQTYDETAASFDNPDFVPVVIHSYRHRHLNAPGEPRFEAVEKRLAERPPIDVPVIVLHGADDPFAPRSADLSAGQRALLPRVVDSRMVPGAGHFMPRERPAAVSRAIADVIAAAG
ncbi:MAG: alpha/beta fold hydrolase [Vicinamibacterales bacterium]